MTSKIRFIRRDYTAWLCKGDVADYLRQLSINEENIDVKNRLNEIADNLYYCFVPLIDETEE